MDFVLSPACPLFMCVSRLLYRQGFFLFRKSRTNKMNISLDETWTFCIRMSKHIAKEMQKDSSQYISDLKEVYLAQNHPDLDLYNDCFFCDYNGDGNNYCKDCPARLVESSFNCKNTAYHYYRHPTDFHKELVRLNKIRKAKGI